MGGRGSSSGGRPRGGKGVNPANIVSTTSLVSEREGYRTEVDQVLTVARDVYQQYGIASDLEVATLKGKDALSTMAYYDSNGNLAINKNYFDAKKMNDAYDACVDSGFHPSRGNKSGMEAVTAHEIGHGLTNEIAKKLGVTGQGMDKVSTEIVKQASKKAGYGNAVVKFSSKISGYAKQSNAEAVAEAFADVYCNGGKAKKESKAIVDVLNTYFK